MEIPEKFFEIGDEVTVQYGMPYSPAGCRPEVLSRVLDYRTTMPETRLYIVQPIGEQAIGLASHHNSPKVVDGSLYSAVLVEYGEDLPIKTLEAALRQFGLHL